MDWKLVSLVGLAGAVGSIGRYLLSGWATRSDFPSGTLLVNVVGCFLIGLLLFGGVAGGWMGPQARIWIGIGLLGGFTTMSSFTYDTVALVEGAEYARATANVALTFVSCLGATFLGRAVGVTLWGGG
jgi:CrcB protein